MNRHLLLGVLLGCTPLLSFANCIVTRAGFDIGSGTTKIKVAKVNSCEQRILEVLLDTSLPVAYKDDLQKSKDNKFSSEIIKIGTDAIEKLQLQARKLGASQYYAVTTSATRTAQNADRLLSSIKERLDLNVVVINQEKEAILGYIAASAKTNSPVVWDIGGGSMQITFRKDKDFIVYKGKIASVSFKNHIIETIQHKKGTTPNPVSQSDYIQALHDARTVAKFSIDQEIKDQLSNPKNTIIGIGGVHYYSILGQLEMKNKNSYSIDQLSGLLPKRLGLKDNEIKSDYADTEISNLILVQGFMRELGIKKVQVEKINLTDALLLSGNSLL